MRFKLDRLLDSLEFDEKQVLKATREIRRFCQNDPELSQCIEYLKTLPGIGWIVASQMLARVGDWRQIKNIRQLPAFLGLVPTERLHRGENRARLDYSQRRSDDCAVNSFKLLGRRSAKTASCREFFRTVAKKHPRHLGSRVAIVAVAHKLCVRAAVVLMKQRPYEVREKVQSAPLTQEETVPQGTTRRRRVPGETNS